jgi:tetratricopeptide (TPR) repeat protein
MGDMHLSNNEYELAEKSYSAAYKYDSSNQEVLNKTLLAKPNNIDDLIVAFGKLPDSSPSKSFIASRLGSYYFNKKEFREAAKYLLDATRLNDKSSASYYYLSIIMQSAKRYDLALEYINKCLDLSIIPVRGAPNALTVKGSLLISLAKYDQAEPCLRSALAIDPNCRRALVLYSQVLLINDKVSLAIAYLDKYYGEISKSRNDGAPVASDARCVDLLIRANIIIGSLDEAKRIYDVAKKRGYNWGSMELLDAYIDLASGHDEDALSKISRVATKDSEYKKSAICIQTVLLSTSTIDRINNIKAAKTCIEQYSEIDADGDIFVLYAKLIVSIQSGEYEKAKQLMNKFRTQYNRFPRHIKETEILDLAITHRLKFNVTAPRIFMLLSLDW